MRPFDWALGVLVIFAWAWHLRTAFVLDRHARVMNQIIDELEKHEDVFANVEPERP